MAPYYSFEKKVMNKIISVVIPVYNCEKCLFEIAEKIIDVAENLEMVAEIIFVDDASTDNSWKRIKNIASKKNQVKGIRFSRNFGQHQAISAGLKITRGQWIVVMDCDLQDDPYEIEKLLDKTKEGYHIVYAKREKRRDSVFKITTSYIFHKVLTFFTNQYSDPSVANFGIYSRKAIDAYNKLSERNRCFPILIRWFGFSTVYIPIGHRERSEGKSSYTVRKLFNLASEIIISHSNKPLYFSIVIGVVSSSLSLSYAVFLIIRYLINSIPVQGWTSIMVSIYLIGGIMLINLGMLGIYLGRVFDHIKQRPIYIIEDEINID